MAVALAASPGQAVPAMPAGGFGMPTPMSPVNEAIVAGDLDAAGRLSDLGDRYLGQDALADAEAAFRGALAIFEAALGPADPRVADSMTALADVRAERRDFTGAESLYQRALAGRREKRSQVSGCADSRVHERARHYGRRHPYDHGLAPSRGGRE